MRPKVTSDYSLGSILHYFWDGECGKVDDSVLSSEGVLEGKMTRAMTFLLLFIALVTIVVNFGVVLRIYKLIRRGGDIRPPFYFIGNLAISDFLVGLYVTVVFCVDLSKTSPEWKNKHCGFLTAMVVTACQETICTITVIAIDKYVFICHGLTYPSKMTRKRAFIIIAFTWCFSLLIGFLPAIRFHEESWCACNFLLYINKGFSILLFLTAMVFPLAIIVYLYAIILSLAIKVTKSKIEASRSSSSGSAVTLLTRLSVSSKHSRLTSKESDIVSFIVNSRAETVDGITQQRQTSADTSISEVATSSVPSLERHPRTKKKKDKDDSGFQINGNASQFETNLGRLVCEDTHNPMSPDLNEGNKIRKSEKPTKSSTSYSVTETENVSEEDDPVKGVAFRKCSSYDAIDSSGEGTPPKKWARRDYFKKLAYETRDKVLFLQKCKAIKVVFLIIIAFVATYGPFVIGTLAYKTGKEPKERLFKALNNLLYCAVVFNSLINPLIYAYGYREFRIKTKRFKGLFARERR